MDIDDERPYLRLLRWVLGLDEVIPWYSGYLYTGMSLTRREKDWLLVVRAQRGKGEQVVSFTTGHRPFSCFLMLAQNVKHRDMNWRPDRYVKKP